jgi:hypothetical protein
MANGYRESLSLFKGIKAWRDHAERLCGSVLFFAAPPKAPGYYDVGAAHEGHASACAEPSSLALVVYATAAMVLFPKLGVEVGTLASYTISMLCSVALIQIQKYRIRGR